MAMSEAVMAPKRNASAPSSLQTHAVSEDVFRSFRKVGSFSGECDECLQYDRYR